VRRAEAVLALVLVVPLALYFVPYAYAAQTTATYAVDQVCTIPNDSSLHACDALCTSGDNATGGGFVLPAGGGLELFAANAVLGGGKPIGYEAVVRPTAFNFPRVLTSEAFCQTPIAVAGIGVPEFGSLYTAIALGAVVFFLLSRYMSGKKPLSVPATTTAS
jgi:hypothetical protein